MTNFSFGNRRYIYTDTNLDSWFEKSFELREEIEQSPSANLLDTDVIIDILGDGARVYRAFVGNIKTDNFKVIDEQAFDYTDSNIVGALSHSLQGHRILVKNDTNGPRFFDLGIKDQ